MDLLLIALVVSGITTAGSWLYVGHKFTAFVTSPDYAKMPADNKLFYIILLGCVSWVVLCICLIIKMLETGVTL